MRMPTNQWDFAAGGGGGDADANTGGYGENYDDTDLVSSSQSVVVKDRKALTPRRDNDADTRLIKQRLYKKNPRLSESSAIFVLENIDANYASDSLVPERRRCNSVFLSDNDESSSSYSATAGTDSRRGSGVACPATSYGSGNRRRSSGGVSSLLLKGRHKTRKSLTIRNCNNNKNTNNSSNRSHQHDVLSDYRRMSAPELPPITTSGDNHMTATLVSGRRRTSVFAEYSTSAYTPRQNNMKLDTGYAGVSIASQTTRNGDKTTQLTLNTGSRPVMCDKGQLTHRSNSNRSTVIRSAVSHGSSSLSRGSDERPQSRPKPSGVTSATKTGISNMKDASEKFQTRSCAVSGAAEPTARSTHRPDRGMLVSRGVWNRSGEPTTHDRSSKLTTRLRNFFVHRKTSVAGATKATTTPREGVRAETSSGNTSRHTGSTDAHQPSWSSRKENTTAAVSRVGADRMLHHCSSESQICGIQHPEPDQIIDNNNTGNQYDGKHIGIKRIHSDQKLSQRLVADLNKNINFSEKNRISIDRTERLVQKHRHVNVDVSAMRRYASTSVLNQNVRPQTITRGSARTGASNVQDDVEGYDSEDENQQRIFNWLIAIDGADVPPDPEITYSDVPPQRDTAIHIVYEGD